MATATDNRQQAQTVVVPALSSFNLVTDLLPTFSKPAARVSGFMLIASGFFTIIFIVVACAQTVTSSSGVHLLELLAELEIYYWFSYLVSLFRCITTPAAATATAVAD